MIELVQYNISPEAESILAAGMEGLCKHPQYIYLMFNAMCISPNNGLF